MYLVKTPDQSERGVDLKEVKRGEWVATLDDGSQVEMKLMGSREGEFLIRINGQMHRISIPDPTSDGELSFVDGGVRFPFEIVHAADLVLEDGLKKTSIEANDVETLTSPITGIIVDVPVTVGQSVDRAESVVVIEAMKMENALGAPISGKISNVFVKAGDTIFVGDPLVEISGEAA